MTTNFKQMLGDELVDVVGAVIVDTAERPPEVMLLTDAIVFETENARCCLVRDEATSRISFTEKEPSDVLYELEDDQFAARISISKIILNNPTGDNRIRRISAFDLKGASALALQIDLACGQVIFVDPTFFSGTNIGGLQQKQLWEDNYPDVAVVHYEIPKAQI